MRRALSRQIGTRIGERGGLQTDLRAVLETEAEAEGGGGVLALSSM